MTTAPDGTGTGYGSHQPALRAIARFTKIRTVIEFGAGEFSTHLFLDQKAFPDLTALMTFEHKGEWAKQVWVDDKRFTLVITSPDNFKDLSQGKKADLVFLDCAPLGARQKLIPHALSLAPIFAIHDYQERTLKKEYKYVKGFNSKIQTVFASNTVDLKELEL